MYKQIPDRAIIRIVGVDTMPARTAVSPKTSAPTIERAMPTYLGILTLASFRISKIKRVKNISKLGESGMPFILLTMVRRKLSGITCK